MTAPAFSFVLFVPPPPLPLSPPLGSSFIVLFSGHFILFDFYFIYSIPSPLAEKERPGRATSKEEREREREREREPRERHGQGNNGQKKQVQKRFLKTATKKKRSRKREVLFFWTLSLTCPLLFFSSKQLILAQPFPLPTPAHSLPLPAEPPPPVPALDEPQFVLCVTEADIQRKQSGVSKRSVDTDHSTSSLPFLFSRSLSLSLNKLPFSLSLSPSPSLRISAFRVPPFSQTTLVCVSSPPTPMCPSPSPLIPTHQTTRF